MFRWIPYTFVRTVFFFIAGILLGIHFPYVLTLTSAVIVTCLLVVIFVVLYFLRLKTKVPFILFSFIGLTSILLLGYVRVHATDPISDPTNIQNLIDPISAYRATVTGFPEEKDKTWKNVAIIQAVKINGAWRKASGNVLLYFRKEQFANPFTYGDQLLINGAPREVDKPGNRGEFDYRKFLSFKRIGHQQFVSREQVIVFGNDPHSNFVAMALNARSWASNTLKRFISSGDERAVAEALILGVTDHIDTELLSAYSSTGAMHVLAVSGLHVSIIYMIVLFVLTPIAERKGGKVLLAAITLFALWSYAFITGLSPSVLRAVTMFSFVIVAKTFSRNTNIYNTLAVSCFCLLLYDPYLIASVGFQLSFLAVLGIVHIHPLIYRRYDASTWLGDKVWTATCVSIAAQVTTFPLALFYFHQFPVYFLLSNFVVIPCSFIILIGGIALLTFSFVDLLASAISVVVTTIIKVMNYSVFIIGDLPFNVVDNIYITLPQCLLLFAVTGFVVLFLQFKKVNYFYASAFLVTVFCISRWSNISRNNYDRIVFYKIPGHTAIDFISPSHAFSYTDSLLSIDENKMKYHVYPNRLLSQVDVVQNVNTEMGRRIECGTIYMWRSKKILYLDAPVKFSFHKLNPDIIVVGNNAVRSLSAHSDLFKNAQVIFDSSNSYRRSVAYEDEAKKLGLRAYAVLLHGSLEINLNSNEIFYE